MHENNSESEATRNGRRNRGGSNHSSGYTDGLIQGNRARINQENNNSEQLEEDEIDDEEDKKADKVKKDKLPKYLKKVNDMFYERATAEEVFMEKMGRKEKVIRKKFGFRAVGVPSRAKVRGKTTINGIKKPLMI